jgi:exopolysaccharide biosynthesis polyprenyl glycosylphosphotransferase
MLNFEKKKIKQRKWVATALLADALFLNLGTVLAFLIRFRGFPPLFNFRAYTDLAFFITLIELFFLYVYELYNTEEVQDPWNIFFSIVKAISFSTLITVFLTFFVGFLSFPRTVFVLSWFLQILLVTIWRLFFHQFFSFEFPPQRVAIVGDNELALEAANEVEKRKHLGYELIGLITPSRSTKKKLKGKRILGTVRYLVKIIEQYDINRLIFATLVQHRELLEKLAEKKGGEVKVDVVPELYEVFIGKVDYNLMGDIPLIELTKQPPEWYQLTKRILDFWLALFFLILLSPLFVIISLAIKLTSPGPVFYIQERVGKGEKVFRAYKFRTMVHRAEEKTGPVLASENDPRITPLGRFLRRYRLDEIPQLVNVLKGDMSFVGPRPERPFFVEKFKKTVPGYSERFRIKPGLTGLAQVSGGYSISARNKLKYDLIYIYNQSLFLDLRIIFQTIKVVLKGKGQ